jgi:hypothetical protein
MKKYLNAVAFIITFLPIALFAAPPFGVKDLSAIGTAPIVPISSFQELKHELSTNSNAHLQFTQDIVVPINEIFPKITAHNAYIDGMGHSLIFPFSVVCSTLENAKYLFGVNTDYVHNQEWQLQLLSFLFDLNNINVTNVVFKWGYNSTDPVLICHGLMPGDSHRYSYDIAKIANAEFTQH